MTNVKWITDFDEALSRAAKETKPVLLDFFNPGWIGCQQMDAVTYPTKNVHEFINNSLVPLRVPADSKVLAERFNVKWTPTLITLDAKGNEHHRTVGFLAADGLIPSLILGIAKTYSDADDYGAALKHLERLITEYGGSDQVPEAIFLQGVCLYKSTHDGSNLKKAYERLAETFPTSEWTKRAYPYRLL